MGRKKIFHKEEYEVEAPAIEQIEQTEQYESDLFDQIKSGSPGYIYFYRYDLDRSEWVHIKRLDTSLCSWDWVEKNLEPGQYRLRAYTRGKGLGMSRTFYIDPLIEDTKIPPPPENTKSHMPQNFYSPVNQNDQVISLLREVLAQKNESKDMSIFLSNMSAAMGAGMKAAMNAVAELIPQNAPDHMFKNLEMLLSLKEKLELPVPRGGYSEKIIAALLPILEKIISAPTIPPKSPPPPPAPISINKIPEPMPSASDRAMQYFFSILEGFSKRTHTLDPALRAAVFLEDLPEEHHLLLESLLTMQNGFDLLCRHCNFINDKNLAWFAKFWDEISQYFSGIEDANESSQPGIN